MDISRLYIWKSEDGKESEPLTQENLVHLAKQGIITPHAKVRSHLLRSWTAAVDVPFLKEILSAVVIKQQEEEENRRGNRLRKQVNLEAEELEVDEGALGKSKLENARTASPVRRLIAAAIDAVLLLLYSIVLYLIFAWLFAHGFLSASRVFYVGFAFWWASVILMGTMVNTGFRSTPGQRFLGIYLICRNGKPLRPGRGFFYFFFTLLFGLSTPFFLFGVGQTLQEICTSTRMVSR